jgi:hypothetical protein
VLVLLPKNESVLLFWKSDGGTKTWRGFLIQTQQHFGELSRCLQRTNFFFFSPKLAYVPFVLARDHLGKLEMEK